MKFGLLDKKLQSVVFDFPERARKPCLGVITPISEGALILIPLDNCTVARDANRAEITARESEIDAWIDLDMEVQAFIVKYLGAFEHMHVRNYTFAYEM